MLLSSVPFRLPELSNTEIGQWMDGTPFNPHQLFGGINPYGQSSVAGWKSTCQLIDH